MLPTWILLAAAVVIPPGHERQIGGLFEAFPWPQGCAAGNVRIESDRIVTRLTCPDAHAYEVALVHPGKAPEAPHTPHYAVLVTGGAPEGFDRAVATALAGRDTFSPWSVPDAEKPRPSLPPAAWAAAVMFLAAWPLAALVRYLRQRRRTTR
jgi:hypothetical protein